MAGQRTGDEAGRTTRRRLMEVAGVSTALGLAGCLGGDGAGPTDTEGDSGGQSDRNSTVGDETLTLATTTSTYDTGLLEVVNTEFQNAFDITVETISQGTGAAIRTGRDGDADIILVHARGPEDQFIRDGAGVNRRDVMFNDFVIVGPEDDPAGINGLGSATEAFATIAEAEATFLSRGDDSGTNTKELNIWAEAGIDPAGSWYRETGQGMGDTLVQADRSGGYTLADRGTFLATQDNIGLVIHVQGPIRDGPAILRNPYGVIPVNPAVHDNVNYQAAMAYVGFLTSPRGQELIGDYTANGSQLFFPNALAEGPDFGQYVPQDYDGPEMSMQDIRFQHWVDQQVPDDF